MTTALRLSPTPKPTHSEAFSVKRVQLSAIRIGIDDDVGGGGTLPLPPPDVCLSISICFNSGDKLSFPISKLFFIFKELYI